MQKLIFGQPAEPGKVVVNSGFWPDIDTAFFRETYRLDGTITNPRLVNALIQSMAEANKALNAWRLQQQENGYASLSDVPCEKINQQSILVTHYQTAVFCGAKARLLEHYRDFDSTDADGEKAGLEIQIIDLRRDAAGAIADVCGRSAWTVELI
jgi:hypothetical protein